MSTYPSISARTTGQPMYVWEVPGKAISIRLQYEVIDRILPEIMKGFGALPRRGAEVGGVLLGRIDPGFVQNVTVDDFQIVPCEYLMGPSYTLSERDRARLEETLQRAQARGLTVVGFFRSHTRKDLFLDDADVALCARYFSNPGNVFLVVKPFATRTSIAGFFFWEEGEIHRDSSYLEFPFHRRELGGGDSRPTFAPRETPVREFPAREIATRDFATQNSEQAGVNHPSPEEPYALAPVPRGLNWSGGRGSFSILAEPEPPPERKTSTSRLLWAPLALAAAIVLGVIGFRASKTEANEVPSGFGPNALPLRLTISETRNHVEVNWDRNAPAIGSALGGLLSIHDGPYRRTVELSAAQLRDGRVRYARMTGDVSLRLEVFSTSRSSVSESIRLVSAEPGLETPPSPDPGETAAARSSFQRTPATPAVRRPTAAPRQVSAVDAVEKPAQAVEKAPEPVQQPEGDTPATATPAGAPAVAQSAAVESPTPEREIPRPVRRR